MEKKFSKGQWSVDEFDSNFDECFYILDDNGNWIATVIIEFPSWAVDTAMANAKLIAAAPDLLDALECIYNDKEVWSELSDTQKIMVEQAIKKATE